LSHQDELRVKKQVGKDIIRKVCGGVKNGVTHSRASDTSAVEVLLYYLPTENGQQRVRDGLLKHLD
jgi:hypothetical protein